MSGRCIKGGDLDKDLLRKGNKVYSKDTCLFISTKLNNMLYDKHLVKGTYLCGAKYEKRTGRFDAVCRNPTTNKKEYLGTYDTDSEAHAVWLERKVELSLELCEDESDPRVLRAVRGYYGVDEEINNESI